MGTGTDWLTIRLYLLKVLIEQHKHACVSMCDCTYTCDSMCDCISDCMCDCTYTCDCMCDCMSDCMCDCTYTCDCMSDCMCDCTYTSDCMLCVCALHTHRRAIAMAHLGLWPSLPAVRGTWAPTGGSWARRRGSECHRLLTHHITMT